MLGLMGCDSSRLTIILQNRKSTTFSNEIGEDFETIFLYYNSLFP